MLIISDSVSATSGLGRITRDLAIRIREHLSDVYRVGTFGLGGSGSRKFDFPQYHVEGSENWVLPTLPEVWEDFAGDEKGIVFCIWDASRLGWFSQPETQCENPVLKQFLLDPPFKKWIYAPIDAEGPNGKLTFPLQQVLSGFDVRLAYGKWAASIVNNSLSLPARTTPFLPHGIDDAIFYQRDREACRASFVSITHATTLLGRMADRLEKDDFVVGIIATNQTRKDWALGIESVAIIAQAVKVKLWIHTDVLERYWSIPALLLDYGLLDSTMISLGYLSDDKMAEAYSACDVTLGIGSGEGFGFPIFESIFCGTPCIHGDYAGAPEHLLADFLVSPLAFRYEGLYSSKRPVFSPRDWARKARKIAEYRTNTPGLLGWNKLWPLWEAWLRSEIRKAEE